VCCQFPGELCTACATRRRPPELVAQRSDEGFGIRAISGGADAIDHLPVVILRDE
jgi:hypothetical protein